MPLGLCRRLVFVIPSLVSSFAAAQSVSSLSSLPPSLATLIPTCASSCVLDYINNDFPACPASSELECLCSRYGKDGLSLGEVALGCVFAACPNQDSSSRSVYTLCVNQQNAVLPTHTAITVTQAVGTTTAPPNSPTAPATRSADSRTTLATHHSSKVSSGDAAATGLGPSAAAITSQPTHSASPGPLTVGQIVGVSVAGAASLIVVVGGLVAVTCIQRRRDRAAGRRSRYKEEKFVDSGTTSLAFSQPPPTPQLYPTNPRLPTIRGVPGVGLSPNQRSPRANIGPGRQSPTQLSKIQTSMQPRHRHQLSDDRPGSQWINPDLHPNDIGLALSPESDHQSPDSYLSTQSTTHLIPENPRPADKPKAATRFPVVPQVQRPDSSASQLTVFEEDSKSPAENKMVLPPSLRVVRAPPVHMARLSPSNVRHVAPSQQSPKPPAPLKISHEQRQPPGGNMLSGPSQQSPKPPPPLKIAGDRRSPPNMRSLGLSQQLPKPNPPPKDSGPYLPIPEPKRQLPLTLEIPTRMSRVPEAPEPPKSPVRVYAPPAYMSPSPQEAKPFNWTSAQPSQGRGGISIASTSSKPRKAQGYLPRYYTRNINSNGPEKDSSPKVVDIRGPATRSSRSNSSSKTPTGKSGRGSAASYTTFESADLEEPTPPEDEEKQLTPVAESPISGLRYPKVPRPSNQAVPRGSPSRLPNNGQMMLPPRSSSLLAKRRGDRAAQELERSLVVPGHSNVSSIYSRASNMSGHSAMSRATKHTRTASDSTLRQPPTRLQEIDLEAAKGPRSAEMMQDLKSPMWAPRITPSRRGDDLFLSVSKIYTE